MSLKFEPTKFQSFDDVSDPSNVAPRVRALRETIKNNNLDAYIIPLADIHRGESLPPGEQRLAYITGFTGSAGLAIIGLKKAALFVDGRYTLQAPKQTDQKIIKVQQIAEIKLTRWIKENLTKGATIGFDPLTSTVGELKTWTKELGDYAILSHCKNLVNAIWQDRPAPPNTPIEILGNNRAGISRDVKINNLQKTLSTNNADALILNVPESINWLFNIRGRDVPNTPVALCFAIVPQTGKPTLFINEKKLTPQQHQQLSQAVKIEPENRFFTRITQLGNDKKTIWFDPASAPYEVARILQSTPAILVEKPDPVLDAKAIKNETELVGMREAHRLDAIAMAKFLSWFDRQAPAGFLTEIDIATALEAFRRQEQTLVDISFDTISGSGPNGAIVHYRVTNSSNRKLRRGELMLVDSGGQYLSGTTDITRTMICGDATREQKEHNTRVLKGMIAISSLQFPPKTTGARIDILARQFLWQAGLNYGHGTGHGVGAFLSVHEGPASISPINNVPLQKGMILSNEPGFYLEGEYGIRIENLIHIVDSKISKGWLAFETLTLVPIDTRLIDTALLTPEETAWINAYHARVLKEIGPFLDGENLEWLQQATRAI